MADTSTTFGDLGLGGLSGGSSSLPAYDSTTLVDQPIGFSSGTEYNFSGYQLPETAPVSTGDANSGGGVSGVLQGVTATADSLVNAWNRVLTTKASIEQQVAGLRTSTAQAQADSRTLKADTNAQISAMHPQAQGGAITVGAPSSGLSPVVILALVVGGALLLKGAKK